MPALRVLLLLLLLTACGGGNPAAGPPSPDAPAMSPSVTAPSSSPDALVLAVSTAQDGLSLYALAPESSEAMRLRDLAGPPGFVVQDVSLSGGVDPTVCAVWRPAEGTDEPQLHCYAPGSTEGRVIEGAIGSRSVGVRQDGRAVAWSSGGFNQALTIADLSGDSPTVRSRELYAAGEPEDAGLPVGIGRLDWVDDDMLAVVHDGDSDEGLGLCFHDVSAPREPDAMGFGRCVTPDRSEGAAGYYRFEGAVALAEDEVATVERPQWCCTDVEEGPGARAVRLRPSDGEVLSVVAFPREGRDVTSVSGGTRALVYTTSADGKDVVTSVRWASQDAGTPISGLPAGAVVVAQP